MHHLYDIINNKNYTKLDHGLTKSDINPKDRQNCSSCLKLTSADLFKILKDNLNTRGNLDISSNSKNDYSGVCREKNNDC